MASAGSRSSPATATAAEGEMARQAGDGTTGQAGAASQAEVAEATTSDGVEKRFAESRQRRLRRLLRQCERVTLMDFNTLALSGWPDNFSLSMARRRRDTWLLGASVAALVFLSGMTGFVPAWFAGGGFGAFVVILLLGFPPIRRLYSSRPSYLDLLMQRQQLLRDARKHVAHLEGDLGLIWQCNELSEFNTTLSAPRFSTLRHLSEQRRLSASLNQREHIRLYLIFLLEAEKAYERMQSAYFEGHRQAIDKGWQSVAETATDTIVDKDTGTVAGETTGDQGKAS
ncbi:hypothetical protein [uncultured Marinobacter sp.]|uniref:hypothetical protein n=1 Tax=uncultured Marinobacter sp. TaxID=187379 RepID=UPI0030D85764